MSVAFEFIGAAPPPTGVIPNFKHPADVLFTANLVVEILCIALVVLFVSLRIFIRWYLTGQLGKEDWVCIGAGIMSISFFVVGITMGIFGGGRHTWEVTEDNFINFKKVMYADGLAYGPAACLTKITLLLVFVRAFSPYRRMMAFIWSFIGGMIIFYVVINIMKVFICSPIAGFWDNRIESTCRNQHNIFIADTVMSVISDLVVLVLPVPLLWSLQMPFGKKIRIATLLGAGGIATATSVIRLVLIVGPLPPDQTVALVQFKFLGVVELLIGVLCACLPAFSVLFNRVKCERSTTRAGYSKDVKLSTFKQLPPSLKHSRVGDGILQKSYIEVGSSENVSAGVWQGEQWERSTDGTPRSADPRYSCHIVSEP